VTVQKFDAGTGWTIVGTAGFSAGTADYTSLAIDSTTGAPYDAYGDSNNGNRATVQNFVAGTRWTVTRRVLVPPACLLDAEAFVFFSSLQV